MVFIGGKYHGTYARVSKSGVWNTTINSGGKYAKHKPPQSTIDLAEKAQELFGMDFTTVDVADTPDGPIVFEVSAFGGFRGAKEGLGIDAADRERVIEIFGKPIEADRHSVNNGSLFQARHSPALMQEDATLC